MKSKEPEYNGLTIRLISFLLSIVPTSVAVSFASLIGNTYLLAGALFPCIIVLALSIVPTPVSPRVILGGGIISFFISVSVIFYTLAIHPDLLRPYMTLPF